MGNIGDTITQTIPTVGSSGTAYATNVDLFLTEVKARLEAKVPRSSLADGLLDMNGNPIANVSYAHISNGLAAPTTPTNSLQAYLGNLYWVNTGGAVQITSGTSLNTASLGGITGDYGGSNPAQFRFVDVDQEYYAYDNYSTGAWAYLWARGIDIAAAATGVNRVRMVYGGAGSYTLTLPPAAPASTSLLKMSSAGAVTTAAAIVRTAVFHPSIYKLTGAWTFTTENSYVTSANPSTGVLDIPLTLPVGCTVTDVTLRVNKTSAGTVDLNVLFIKDTDGTATTIGTGTSTAAAPGLISIPVNPAPNETTVSGKCYRVKVNSNASTGGGDTIYHLSVTYSEPATFAV